MKKVREEERKTDRERMKGREGGRMVGWMDGRIE